ncbi:Ribonuclease HI [Rosistilla ulvae]|uniref:Ribonuclease HI n=1 Tax=Rosistilla ulvae TaxID=1930277 RepID=A0A517M046_9BACT|nr:hypothetical protein [Rosistilla ulvae]QDS88242.1 Ribonuclease HI [Rosistilla ulvae]
MVAALPEYLLVCETRLDEEDRHHWRFSLETILGQSVVEASDHEPCDLNRLALLAVVRGLEALDGPSCVTMMCSNRYVIHGLRNGLSAWRETRFSWDHFGRMVTIPNADLWRRIDRALDIHQVSTCWLSAAFLSQGRNAARMPESRPAPLDRIRKWLAGQAVADTPTFAVA